jgi:SAM-dependent methyltransferase
VTLSTHKSLKKTKNPFDMDNVKARNQKAWNQRVAEGNRWTIPVAETQIASAKAGNPHILLSPTIAVPQSWLGLLSGKEILALASGGGQQGPLLAAAGANVTVFDLSDQQLQQDKETAQKFGLNLNCVQGSADCLSAFGNGQFDLIINPCSNCYFEHLEPVWSECARVLKPGGEILFCFTNPVAYCFDDNCEAIVKSLPVIDEDDDGAFEFSHSLNLQIGSLCRAGFGVTDLFEDNYEPECDYCLKYFPAFVNVRATRL